ncbi:MAG: archaellum operon transcriptional activator EarA family protein [Rhabdochlamydiaceae bacterium]
MKSRVRRITLHYLMNRRRPVAISEISRFTNLTMTQVIGALHGIRGQYEPQLSLIHLGLVKMSEQQIGQRKVKLYSFSVDNHDFTNVIRQELEKYMVEGEF